MRTWFFLLVIAAFACNEINECDLDPDVGYAVVVFYDYHSPSTPKQTNWNLVYNDQSSYYYYNLEDTSSVFGLLLTPEDSILTYYWETDSVTYDLTFKYNVEALKIYYPECEPTFEFNNLRVDTTGILFDSVAVVSGFINKNVPVNVEVYF
ncbi:hypothetical protein [Marinoscillum sp. MHG1-6]|uniref:hypothetical protein n=1 Tax=Marinoscillum sp. MHG1-6 TaxID=2959627 RepID=UPI002156F748|nr:hypothetical protein [Marinoscillum sp. MHG1-6]